MLVRWLDESFILNNSAATIYVIFTIVGSTSYLISDKYIRMINVIVITVYKKIRFIQFHLSFFQSVCDSVIDEKLLLKLLVQKK